MYARRPLPALVAAALGAVAGGALAEPVGPAVVQGSAAVANAARVTTVTPSTASTLIRWQGFGLAPGDTARFNQAAGSVVFNQVAPGGAFALAGSIESAGRVVFLNGSVATGAGLGISGLNLDLASLNRSALRLERLDAAPGLAARAQQDAPAEQSLATLSEGRVFVLGEDKASVSTNAGGAVMLAPGRTVQLADLRYPNLRVEIAAPAGGSLDLTALLARSGQIFASLLSARGAPVRRSESPSVQVANVASPVVFALAAMSRSDAPAVVSRELLAMIPDPAAMAQADALRAALQDALDESPVRAAPIQVAAAAPLAAIAVDEDRASLPTLLGARLRSTEEIQPPAALVAAVGPDEDGMRLPLRALAGLAVGEALQAPVLVAALGPDEDRGALPQLFVARLALADASEPVVPQVAAIGPDEDGGALPVSLHARLASTEWLQVPAVLEIAQPAVQVASLSPIVQPVAAAAVTAVARPAATEAVTAAATAVVPVAVAATPVAAPPARVEAPVLVAAIAPQPATLKAVDAPEPVAKPAPPVAVPLPVVAAAPVQATVPQPAPVLAAATPVVPVAVAARVEPSVQVAMAPQAPAAVPVASDGGAVKLARVERRMPMIMIDRKGGIFHM